MCLMQKLMGEIFCGRRERERLKDLKCMLESVEPYINRDVTKYARNFAHDT